jgi:hypothetical protein
MTMIAARVNVDSLRLFEDPPAIHTDNHLAIRLGVVRGEPRDGLAERLDEGDETLSPKSFSADPPSP